MQLLPLELKLLIIEFSSGSPSTLAALARTHPAYQREAEKALYAKLSIYTSSHDSLKCMESLATNSEKAALVRFLAFEYSRKFQNTPKMMTYLSKSLINMNSLSDFRIKSWPGDEAKMKRLGKILWSVCKIFDFFFFSKKFIN